MKLTVGTLTLLPLIAIVLPSAICAWPVPPRGALIVSVPPTDSTVPETIRPLAWPGAWLGTLMVPKPETLAPALTSMPGEALVTETVPPPMTTALPARTCTAWPAVMLLPALTVSVPVPAAVPAAAGVL